MMHAVHAQPHGKTIYSMRVSALYGQLHKYQDLNNRSYSRSILLKNINAVCLVDRVFTVTTMAQFIALHV